MGILRPIVRPRFRAQPRDHQVVDPLFSRAWTPRYLPNLTSWLDARDQKTLFSDAGTTVIAADGLVYQWSDKSGNGRHFSQTTEANRPTWKAGGYVLFPGGAPSTVLLTSGLNCSAFLSTTNNTIMLVARWVSAVSLQIWGNPSSTGTNHITAVAGPKIRATLWNGTAGQSQITTANNIAPDTDYIISVTRSGTSLMMAVNGVAEPNVTTASTLTNLATPLGVTAPSSSNVGQCRIYEALTCNAALSLANRNRVGRYLAAKYGLTWTNLAA